MEVAATEIADMFFLRTPEFVDDRGKFFESYNVSAFSPWLGNLRFVQDNQTRSRKGVIRGLHYQTEKVQGKLVRVLRGVVFDVVVDLRKSSSTFGRWHGFQLCASDRWQVWIPPGLAHGFLALSDNTEVFYKVTDYWHPQSERTLRWDDPHLRIRWPLPAGVQPILSLKDAEGLAWDNVPKFD